MIISRRGLFSTLLATIILTTPARGLTLIFDLNGVLFTTNYWACFQVLGLKEITYYYLTGHNPSALKKKLYKVMDTLYPTTTASGVRHDDEGVALPYLMQAWNLGTICHQEILALLKSYIFTHPHAFESATEQTLVWRLAQLIFDPLTFVKTRALIPDMVTFLAECKRDGHQIYALSNWDPTSFELFYAAYPDFFAQFDGIMISGAVGKMKPDPDLFTLLLNLYNLTPRTCIFLDDQKENTAAAHALGIHTILCAHTHSSCTRNRPDIGHVRHKYNFIKEQLLPSGI